MAEAKSEVKIRVMEPEDITGILEIDRKISEVQRAITYRDLMREALGGQMEVGFVAEIGDQMVGFVLANVTYVREQITEPCVIQIFGVDPKYQGQGIATKLFQGLLEQCRTKGIRLVRVMIEERDSQLQAFFKRLGFDRGRYVEYSMSL